MEKKTYRITFMADLTEDDVRAMKKCFYDAMAEAMEIGPCWELQLEEIKFEGEPNPDCDQLQIFEPTLDELLKKPLTHINDVRRCFEACKSKSQVSKVILRTPSMFGEFYAEFDDECKVFTVINTYFDDNEEEVEEEYQYDYPEDWKD